MYLLSTKPSAPRREKRSSLNEGKVFLQGLRQSVGSETFDSFMAVQGDVSLMFVMDDTGSMSDEIEAAKNIAIDIINYPRSAPIVTYILSPFNDPYPAGKCQAVESKEKRGKEQVRDEETRSVEKIIAKDAFHSSFPLVSSRSFNSSPPLHFQMPNTQV